MRTKQSFPSPKSYLLGAPPHQRGSPDPQILTVASAGSCKGSSCPLHYCLKLTFNVCNDMGLFSELQRTHL